MDRRTLLAVVLSVIVIIVGFSIQNLLLPQPEPPVAGPSGFDDGIQRTQPVTAAGAPAAADGTAPATADGAISRVPTAGEIAPAPAEGLQDGTVTYRNNLIEVVFDRRGGSVMSYRLLEHLDGDAPVDMIFRGSEEQRAFTLHFGTRTAPAVDALFRFAQIDADTIQFTRDFHVVGQEEAPFSVVRTYRFRPGEYLFETDVELRNSVNAFLPLNFANPAGNPVAYTLGFGPQIGPSFEALDQRSEFRHYLTREAGRRKSIRVSTGSAQVLNGNVEWASIAGKYFAVVALVTGSDVRNLTAVLAQEPREGLTIASQIYLARPVIGASSIRDTYRFFVGPKTPAVLDRYDNAQDNAWGRSDLKLGDVQETRLLFGWLENILKWVLQVIVRVVPNYGVAIIILTLVVKLALWPLTRKSYESTAHMQAVQPKMAEIKERYKDDQTKQNQATAELYKKEGVNPLGGCLPMLAQFPFFLAMYGLFNNHFDLRGATFIPGWIPDLSAPDVIFDLGSFEIPFVGSAIRALPVIFLATQLVSSKMTQQPSASQSNSQMKLMQYGLPIVFFFILYNLPSGLLVYWIFSNVLTSGQQYYYNKKKPTTPPPVPARGSSGKGPPGKGSASPIKGKTSAKKKIAGKSAAQLARSRR